MHAHGALFVGEIEIAVSHTLWGELCRQQKWFLGSDCMMIDFDGGRLRLTPPYISPPPPVAGERAGADEDTSDMSKPKELG